jgi:pterin-4a-carbinolamine dehydratase
MQTIYGLMSEYFSPSGGSKLLFEGVPKDVPITAKQVIWRQTKDAAALIRSYEFKDSNHLRLFIDQLLAMQTRVEHEAQILIEGKVVKIRVGTKSLERVTEMDVEYAAEADSIYEETHGVDDE